MAQTILSHSDSADGWVTVANTTSWALARDASTGTADHNDTSQQYAIRARKVASGRGLQWRVARAFFAFDTSAITAIPVSGTLNIVGHNSGTANIRVVKSIHNTTLANADFNAITGWTSGDNSSNVTYYETRKITAWSTSAYNSIALSQTALSDIASLDTFKLCLLEADYDLTDTEPSTGVDIYSGCIFVEDTSGTRDPYIEIHPDNATFFGANF
jgi:hypothetical protein